MQFSTFTQIILLACAPLAMAGVAASPVDSLNVFESRANPIVCNKADCGGVGKACAGKWCCVRYNENGCKCIGPGETSENNDHCPA